MTAVPKSELKNLVGERLPPSRWFQVSQDLIATHADTSQDWQYIHLDAKRAAETPFGGTVAHGFLTLSMLSVMSYEAQPRIDGAEMSVNYGFNRLRFVSPVRAGSEIRGHFTLKSVEELPPNILALIWDVEVEIRDNPKPALVAEWLQRHYLSE